MTVLLFTDSDVFAGTERHIFDLASALRDENLQVTVACPVPSPLAAQCQNARLRVLDVPKSGLIDWKAIRVLRRLLRSEKVAVVHAHNARTALLSALAIILARRGRLVTTQHALWHKRTLQNGLKAKISLRAHRWLAGQTHGVIAISDAVRDLLVGRGDNGAKIVVVRNGIPDISQLEVSQLEVSQPDVSQLDNPHLEADQHDNPQRDNPQRSVSQLEVSQLDGEQRENSQRESAHRVLERAFEDAQTLREKLEIGDAPFVDAPFVFCAARLEREKDLSTLVSAMKTVAETAHDARCLVAGEGVLRDELQRQIDELELRNHICLLGFRDDVLSLMRACDVFVLPSLAEPFGLVLVEAMALGKPVVATDAGGPREIVQDGESGFLVAPSQPRELADALLKLLNDEDARAQMGRKARARYETHFTAKRMAQETADVYRKANPKR